MPLQWADPKTHVIPGFFVEHTGDITEQPAYRVSWDRPCRGSTRPAPYSQPWEFQGILNQRPDPSQILSAHSSPSMGELSRRPSQCGRCLSGSWCRYKKWVGRRQQLWGISAVPSQPPGYLGCLCHPQRTGDAENHHVRASANNLEPVWSRNLLSNFHSSFCTVVWGRPQSPSSSLTRDFGLRWKLSVWEEGGGGQIGVGEEGVVRKKEKKKMMKGRGVGRPKFQTRYSIKNQTIVFLLRRQTYGFKAFSFWVHLFKFYSCLFYYSCPSFFPFVLLRPPHPRHL